MKKILFVVALLFIQFKGSSLTQKPDKKPATAKPTAPTPPPPPPQSETATPPDAKPVQHPPAKDKITNPPQTDSTTTPTTNPSTNPQTTATIAAPPIFTTIAPALTITHPSATTTTNSPTTVSKLEIGIKEEGWITKISTIALWIQVMILLFVAGYLILAIKKIEKKEAEKVQKPREFVMPRNKRPFVQASDRPRRFKVMYVQRNSRLQSSSSPAPSSSLNGPQKSTNPSLPQI